MSSRRFDARHAELDAIREFVDATCAKMSRDDRHRVFLLVEELFTNSVIHGYGAESGEPVWLTVGVTDAVCSVVYEDEARAYDPFGAVDHARLDASVEDRPIGGLGIYLLTEMSSKHSYARRGKRNVIEFDVPLSTNTGSDSNA
jgi:anti-sigma regulatory factor (Ser/Thr protein kinase)